MYYLNDILRSITDNIIDKCEKGNLRLTKYDCLLLCYQIFLQNLHLYLKTVSQEKHI